MARVEYHRTKSRKRSGKRTRVDEGKRPVWWSDKFYLIFYKLASQGVKNAKLGELAGVSKVEIMRAVETNPVLAELLAEAREEHKAGSFVDHVTGLLPEEARRYWEAIIAVEEGKYTQPVWGTRHKVPLKELSRRMRQRLFLHALVHTNFNFTKACRVCRISYTLYYQWCKEAKFGELVQAMHQEKKDFYESALISLVARGDAAAIIFANRTLNRDRGYSDKVEVSVSGTVEHRITVDDLELPLETKMQLLQAYRAKQAQLQAPKALVVDSEVAEELADE